MARKTSKKPDKLKRMKVTILLEKKLVEAVTEKLGVRGTDIATYLQLHLRSFARAKAVLHLKDSMNFGKYFGEKVENVVRTDPSYIAYCLKTDGGTKFASDVLLLLEELSEKEREASDPEDIPFG